MECEKCKRNWKERELDDKYWSEVVKKRDAKIKRLKKEASSLRGQILSAIKRKNWWKNKSLATAEEANK